MNMKRLLTPEQIEYALRTTNVSMISELSGASYSSCKKLSNPSEGHNYTMRTLQKLSDYLLKEHEKLSEVYGLK